MCSNHRNISISLSKNTEFLLRVGIRCFYDKNILENLRFYIHVFGDNDDGDYDDEDDDDGGGADGNNFENEVVVRKLDIEPDSFF